MAQDVGAHRRKEATHQWTAEDELWKRAFWSAFPHIIFNGFLNIALLHEQGPDIPR